MEYVKTIGEIDFWRFRPDFMHLYFTDYPAEDHPWYEKRPVHRIRMMLELFQGGYDVYYMYVDKRVVGHIVVTRGGRRLRMSTARDIVLGPIWVAPRFRNRGFASKGICAVLHDLGLEYENAWEFIAIDNYSSQKTVEKNGYEFMGEARERGPMKRIELSDGGAFRVYRYSIK